MDTLEEIDQQLYDTYQWWHINKPGVTPVEVGRLAQLWRAFDRLVVEQKVEL